jgi:hypothetical protein
MILFLGLLMLFLGLPMVIVGQVALPGGLTISARRSRLSGAIMLSFFPLALLTRLVIGWLETSDFIFVQLAYWLIASGCLLGAFVPLFPVFFGKRNLRSGLTPNEDSAANDQARPRAGNGDPFDFS